MLKKKVLCCLKLDVKKSTLFKIRCLKKSTLLFKIRYGVNVNI